MAIKNLPLSPVTGVGNTKLVGKIESQKIVELYNERYETNVKSYFEGVPFVEIYECAETGYRFYHPFELEGKENLYQALQKFPWFYQAGKWEHKIAIDRLRNEESVLDIGCGTGEFLQMARAKGLVAEGLEMNEQAALVAEKEGLVVHNDDIETLADRFPQKYDVITAFQVLEHISAVRAFLNACLKALKPEGLLIIGVPNNDSFIKYDSDAVLNAPPHHMGLWNVESLKMLPTFFPIDLEFLEFETLQQGNVNWYQSVMERRYLPKNRILRSAYYRSGANKLIERYIVENTDNILGHTVMAVYRKRA